MTKLFELLAPDSSAQLQQLHQTKQSQARQVQQARLVEELERTQNDELPPESTKQRAAGYAVMAHGKPCYNAWVSGRLGKSSDPEEIFADYRAGDTSGRWEGYLQRAEIDPPKRNR